MIIFIVLLKVPYKYSLLDSIILTSSRISLGNQRSVYPYLRNSKMNYIVLSDDSNNVKMGYHGYPLSVVSPATNVNPNKVTAPSQYLPANRKMAT
jgi:hypothetical protein